MLGTTHLLFSLLFGSILFDYVHPSSLIAKLVFAVLLLSGTFLPDLDLKLPFLKHRGLLHTLWPVILVLIVNVSLEIFLQVSIAALAFGWGSHLIADCLTPFGIAPIYPLYKGKIKGPIRTGSWLEKLICGLILVYLIIK